MVVGGMIAWKVVTRLESHRTLREAARKGCLSQCALRNAVKAKGTASDTALATATAAAKSYGAQEATDSMDYRAAVAAAKPAIDLDL
jgi:hypothetical protein